MVLLYMVTFTINIPPMLAYIPAPWIRHGYKYHILHLGPTWKFTWTRRDPIGGRVTTRHLR